jgi:Rrf2 family protein
MPLLPCKSILAVGAVVDIALNSGREPGSARDLADRLALPRRRYLEHILQALVREGILVSERGKWGGYTLAKARDAISVFDISEAIKTVETEKPSEECSVLLGSVVMPALMQAERCFVSTMKRITVEDLAQAARLQMLASYKPDAIAG